MKIVIAVALLLATCSAMDITYSFAGFNSSLFDTVLHKYPLPALARILDSMGNNSQLIIRPFNFGSTKSYEDHTGVGKNTNVKGKSCRLADETLNGKITYIQSNAYTGRSQPDNKITYIGKHAAVDELALNASRTAFKMLCSNWRAKPVPAIKTDVINALKRANGNDSHLNETIEYINERFMWKVKIGDNNYLTTEFVTVSEIESNTQLPVTQEICQNGQCKYEVSDQLTNKVNVLAYLAFNLDTCTEKAFELVADMDVLTIHFPYAETKKSTEDLTRYFKEPQGGPNCKKSFSLGFGISNKLPILYDYMQKLMAATAQWGLIRHSIEALNFCFPQPFETNQYYLLLSKSIVGNGDITIIFENATSTNIKDTVRGWFLLGKCTPLNPHWLFPADNVVGSRLWEGAEAAQILKSNELKNNCPTYNVISMINKDGATIPTKSVKAKTPTPKHLTRHMLRHMRLARA